MTKSKFIKMCGVSLALAISISAHFNYAAETIPPSAQSPALTSSVLSPVTSAVQASRKMKINRILFLGDSITCGVRVSQPAKRYSSQVTKLLKTTNPNIKEINLGRSGRALCQQSKDYARQEVLAANPDAVVIAWGVNDAYWGFSAARYLATYETLVDTLREAKPQMLIVITTLVPDYRTESGFELWIGEANVGLQEIAARYQCPLADIHRAFDHDRKSYTKDIVHPNDQGAAKMAMTIYDAMIAPIPSATSFRVSFDQGQDVRFMQYIFAPERTDALPHWVEVSEFNPQTGAMKITTPLPIHITKPEQPKNATVVVTDAKGTEISRTAVSAWARTFLIHPKDYPQPFTVTFQ